MKKYNEKYRSYYGQTPYGAALYADLDDLKI